MSERPGTPNREPVERAPDEHERGRAEEADTGEDASSIAEPTEEERTSVDEPAGGEASLDQP
ncbi:MAG TPA: hypothetical protein VG295_13400 [Solirubrobacteraceae bacterium]|jgi:hypothetical protein|nr:hypothetical protein [Solirubrobacteraceae bacterium]